MIKEIITRWNATTPDFWKKIKAIAVKVGISAVSVLGADKLFSLQSYGISPVVFTIAGYVIVVCATLGLAAQITQTPKQD
jgi:hypothetical protein